MSRPPEPAHYRSAARALLESAKIFGEEWVFVGRSTDLATVGDHLTTTVADVPIVVVRSEDGLTGLINSCVHRGAVVVDDEVDHRLGHAGTATARRRTARFRCPYHAWVYRLDGALVATPHFDRNRLDSGAPPALTPVAVTEWEGLVFVCLHDDPPPLASSLSGLTAAVDPYRMADYVTVHRTRERWACNWKVLVENFLDTYHLFEVHRETFAADGVSHDRTRFALPDDVGCHQIVEDDPNSRFGVCVPDDQRLVGPWRHTSIIGAVFPNLLIQLQPDWMWILRLEPVDVDQVQIEWSVAVTPATLDAAGDPTAYVDPKAYVDEVVGFLSAVNDEDRVIAERVQRGLAGGRLLGPVSELERNIEDFHRYLQRRLDPGDTSTET